MNAIEKKEKVRQFTTLATPKIYSVYPPVVTIHTDYRQKERPHEKKSETGEQDSRKWKIR